MQESQRKRERNRQDLLLLLPVRLNVPHHVAMFGAKIFTKKPVLLAIESKVKPLNYGMVAMSSSWLSITRWLVMSFVLTASRAAFSPEGK